jgi:hypothetical protein
LLVIFLRVQPPLRKNLIKLYEKSYVY